MKKKMIAALAGLWMASTLMACSGSEEVLETKTYTADSTEVKEVAIDVKDREIEVVLSGNGQIQIDYAESEKEYYDIALSEEGVLTMTSESRKEWTDYIGGSGTGSSDKITLRLPGEGLPVLSLRTTKEDITLPALAAVETITLSTNGGDIFFDGISAGSSIMVENKNGDITGIIAGSFDDYAIACRVKKGDSNLPEEKSGGSRSLTVQNNNGDVEITFIPE